MLETGASLEKSRSWIRLNSLKISTSRREGIEQWSTKEELVVRVKRP
jgi:hypothetical protein